jgi:tRNA modification GTPase
MRFNLTDTITAIATPAGTSALSVIRVSGTDAISGVSRVFSLPKKLLNAEGYKAVHGYIQDGSEVIDEVVCLVFRTPHSYTGEDMVEISGHGNPDLTSRILQLLLSSFRMAEPGEFTFRAFMNHKLDLAQAEAVSDLIHAQTAKAGTAALNQLKGNLSNEISALVLSLADCRIRFELSIDFADQDLPELDLSAVRKELEAISARLGEMLQSGRQGRILRDGFSVCLSGAPNVGKSSVFNRFLAENRAIVTPVPGTTRDYLEEWLSLDSYPIRLIDTAGLRDTQDVVEKLGIDRTREIIGKADLVILMTDPGTLDNTCCNPDAAYAEKTLCVLNKTDLLGFDKLPETAEWNSYLKSSRFASKIFSNVQLIPCSTVLEDGIGLLRQQIVSRIALPDLQPSTILVTNTRHLAAIERSLASLDKALEAITLSAGYEFIAFDLIEAISALSEITGAITTDAMLERIFSSFCIGK